MGQTVGALICVGLLVLGVRGLAKAADDETPGDQKVGDTIVSVMFIGAALLVFWALNAA